MGFHVIPGEEVPTDPERGRALGNAPRFPPFALASALWALRDFPQSCSYCSMLRKTFVLSALLAVLAGALVSALACAIAPSAATAQWSVVKTFPSGIYSVYFQDQVGAGTTGFVGLYDGEIWRTVDNGVTWSATTTPSLFNATVQQFAFRSTTQGWCATATGVWTTIDGGLHWTALSVNGDMVSIGYNAATSELIAINWTGMAYHSNDLGVTWTTFAPPQQNGVTFSGLNGVISTYMPNQSFLFSIDGGLTWAAPSPTLQTECWSPFGVPGSTMFFAVAEHTGPLFRSTNGGASWSNPYTFAYLPTGCIMGTLANLFVQTVSNGFYCSTDQGSHWYSVCGPTNNRDTRFYSKGKEVFAGDNASRNLWYNPDGTNSGNSTLSLDKMLVRLSGFRCRVTDSMIRVAMTGGCSGGVLTKAQILSGSPNFFLSLLNLPKIIIGRDSIAVGYSPSKSLQDSGQLLLEFTTGTRTIDTIISLYGTGQQSSNYAHAAQITMVAPYACVTKDSMLVITNLSCDTLTLTSALLSDSSHFHILPSPASSLLPKQIGPYDSAVVAVRVSSLRDGTFLSMLRLRILTAGGTQINDSVPFRLDVTQGGEALFGALSLAVLNRCVTTDTSFQIAATPCDSIVLLAASLSDTTVFRLTPIVLPHTIAASGAVALPILVVSQPKGNYTTLLHVRYLSGQQLVDTTITLTLAVQNDIPILATLSKSAIDMGAVNVPCDESAREFWVANSLCRNLTITKLAWDPPDGEYSFDSLALPITIGNGDSTHIHVRFKPDSVGGSTRVLRVTLNLDGTEVDTLIPVTAQAVSSFRDTLLSPVLRFDTLRMCQQQDLEGDLINLTCDSIVAISTLLADTNNFVILSPNFPQKIGSHDTLHVKFRLKPRSSGELHDSATILVHNPVDGKDYPRTIALSGYVQPIVHLLAVDTTFIRLTSLPPCGSADSSVLLRNLGTCDDIVINKNSIGGYAGISFTSPLSLPDTLHPGDSVRVYFHIAPNEDSLEQSQIRFTGLNIDTSIALTYATRPGAHALAFSKPDSVFQTRPCQSVTKTYWITDTGCGSLLVDSIALSALAGGTQFQLVALQKLPAVLQPRDTLRFTVQYDPNVAGDPANAILSVLSGQVHFARNIQLAGNVSGTIPTARIGIATHDLTQSMSSRAGVPVSVKVLMLDAVGDSSALQTVTLDLQYNWNLLTMSTITVAPGWSIVDSVEKAGGMLHLKLRHDLGGAVADSIVLAEIFYKTTIGDSIATDIAMTNLLLNDVDANYARCTLTSFATPRIVRYTTNDTCGNGYERDWINNNLILDVISLRPNPALKQNSGAHATLTLALGAASEVSVQIRDMLGREYAPFQSTLGAGTHAVEIDLTGAAEGAYFVTVEASSASGHSRQSRKLLIQAE